MSGFTVRTYLYLVRHGRPKEGVFGETWKAKRRVMELLLFRFTCDFDTY